MFKADKDTQLIITVNNRVGTLAEVAGVVSSSGINLLAICAYAVSNEGVIMFVTENNKEARRLLQAQGYTVREEEVIVLTLDNKPGALQAVTRVVADEGIDLNLIYGSADKKGKTCRMVLISENNEAVMLALKTMRS